jgi:hypothetical protein
MADENETPEGDEKETGATSELGEAGKRALEAERKARRTAENEAKELRAKVKEAEDAEKTELERLQGQVADLTTKAEAATARADRYEIAAEKGLTPAQARRLVGATREELEADADAMAEELGLKKDEGKDEDTDTGEELPQDERPIGRPTENLRSGASNTEDEAPDASKLADSILKSPW